MDIRITPGKLCGTLEAPPSKSHAHRLMTATWLAGKKISESLCTSEDTRATFRCLNELHDGGILDCGESGTTLRFLLPVASALGINAEFIGHGRLPERPMSALNNALRENGAVISADNLPIKVSGQLHPGVFRVPGNISSQFISGLLFALPLLDGDSEIVIEGKRESVGYIDMTLDTLRSFSINIEETQSGYKIKGPQKYIEPYSPRVQGDWSNAAFLIALSRLVGTISVSGLNENSVQGDRFCTAAFDALDGENAEIDLKDCPDLAPILFSYAAYKNGGKFINTRRLRVKESDRANVMAEELKKFGANVKVYENSVEIEKTQLKPPIVPLCGHNDHRIVMALSVLAAVFGAEIEGAEAVNKSYPDFFRVIKKAGVNVYEIR